MLDKAQLRALPLVNKTAEHAPMVTSCCNACRTCVQTNLIGLAIGGAVALATGARRLARRLAKPS